jgi:hypothetical protein
MASVRPAGVEILDRGLGNIALSQSAVRVAERVPSGQGETFRHQRRDSVLFPRANCRGREAPRRKICAAFVYSPQIEQKRAQRTDATRTIEVSIPDMIAGTSACDHAPSRPSNARAGFSQINLLFSRLRRRHG